MHIRPRDGETFLGEEGAVLNGAVVLPRFEREDKYWVVAGQAQQGEVHGEGMRLGWGREYKGCAFPEDLFIDDKPLWQVMSKGELEPGKWYFDYEVDCVYLAEDPNGRKVELSSARHAFSSPAGNVRISSLTIEKYACPAQHGAVEMTPQAKDWTVEDCDIRLNHGLGVKLFAGARLHYNRIHHNGQMGIGAIGEGIQIMGNEISHNNFAGFNVKWEAGGAKFVRTNNLVVRCNYSHHNKGPGLWTDIDNIRTLYEGNTVEDNEYEGIFHEISYSAVIRNNTVRRNGFKDPKWGYGAGILISSSGDVEVTGNRVENNARAITLVMQKRGSGAHGPYELKNVKVRGNVIVNEDTQTALSGGRYPRDKMYMGLFQDVGDKAYFTAKGNEFSGNVYSSEARRSGPG